MPRQRRLQPILDRDSYHIPVRDEIEYYFYDLLYKPLLDLLKEDTGLKGIKINASCLAVPLNELLPCPHNRTLDRAKVDAIKANIEETGTIRPFVVSEVLTDFGVCLMITDGHHRHIAIKELTKEGKLRENTDVPCVISGEKGINSAQYEMRRKINSKTSAVTALKDGRLQWIDGVFVGQLNASISKYMRQIGGKFNKLKKGWTVDLEQMPQDLKVAVMDSRAKSRELIQRLQRKIDEIEHAADLITRPVDPKAQVGKILEGLDDQFEKTTAETLSIKPELTPGMKMRVETEYSQNLNKYIIDWQDEAIFRLRDQVEANAFAGFRADTMVARIQAESGVSKRKAEFLARQETSLLVSKYREVKYVDAGINEYQWSTSHDDRVRSRHKELDGRIFKFTEPPITDNATGARNNPGEDYNCRCVAIPIFNESWERQVPSGRM